MTPGEIAAEGLVRARIQLARIRARAFDNPESTGITDEECERALRGAQPMQILKALRREGSLHLTPGLADLDGTIDCLKRLYPDSVAETAAEADAVLAHRVTVFDRVFDLGPQIDWHRDPSAGGNWPLKHFTNVPLRIGGGSDVRVVWELNRLHHLVTLGRAYALTRNERYTEEFLLQLASWYEANPVRYGVNWMVAMEAGIRAANLIATLQLFRNSPLLDESVARLMIKMLISHGRFIRSNLELSATGASNHYLSDLIGLYVIGLMLPHIQESSSWVNFSAGRILEEMDRQVLPDGVDYEGSTAYHRFVLEIFIAFFALSKTAGLELPRRHWERLRAMFDFVRHYLKPDGTAPLLGDSDDGRFIRFKSRPAIDHSYLMSHAAVLLEDHTFKHTDLIDEETIWWFGNNGRRIFEGLDRNDTPVESKGFENAQIYVQRLGPLYAIVDCGDSGIKGRGSHAHCDAMSVELFAFGRTLLRDPGAFLYTASDAWRNKFRSTAYHNTVRVDGKEICEIIRGLPFALGNVRPMVNRWDSTPDRDRLDAEHTGYARLPRPVAHRRTITFEKTRGYWLLEDHFTGDDSDTQSVHWFEFFFNFDSGISVELGDKQQTWAGADSASLVIAPVSEHTFEIRIATRWVSLSYGTRTPSFGIIYRLYAAVPFTNRMLLIPFRDGDELKVRDVLDAAEHVWQFFYKSKREDGVSGPEDINGAQE
jgi:hypothetical protein